MSLKGDIKMEEDLIFGMVYSEVNEELGPNPIFWVPSNVSEEIKMHISVKTFTLLTAEKGVIPKSLVIIPFPSIEMKGIIKFIQMKDETRRGNVYNTALTLLFKDFDDVIFYKGIEHFNSVFDDFTQNVIKIHELKEENKNILTEIETLRKSILNVLSDIRTKEQSEAFPEKSFKDADYQFKIIVCGEPMVGKTSTVLRFTDNAFKRTYISTLGVNVSQKVVNVKNMNIQLVLWDLAGQSKFEAMRTAFYKGSKGVLLVFDLTNINSFNTISRWYQDIKKNIDMDEDLKGFILGNKNDLEDKRQVSNTEAEKLAKELDLEYFETSALTGENVKESIEKLAEILYLINK